MFKNRFFQMMLDADNGTQLGANGEGNGTNGDGTDKTNENQEAKPLTAEDVQKMVQSETDKVRSEYSNKLKEKEKELEEFRLSSMTEAEKKAELEKQLKNDLSDRETKLLQKELSLNTIDLLKENQLPIEFKDFLVGKDMESTQANVENFQKVFNSALEAAVTERFKQTGKDHQESSGDNAGHYSMEDIAKMSASEINDNWDKVQRSMAKNK